MTSPNITDYDDTMMPPEMEPAAPSATLVVMITYVIAFILIFFVMGGYLPTPSARISSLEASSSTSDVVGGQLFQAGTWALAACLMLPYLRQIFGIARRMTVMMCIPIVAIASTVWSQQPGTSSRRGIFLLLGTIFAFYLVRRFTAERLAEIIVVTGVIAGLLGIFVSVALPSYGLDSFNGNAWQGIFRSKNGSAQIMLFFLSAATCFKFKKKGIEMLRWLLFPVAGLLIVMSHATTGWIIAPGMIVLSVFLKQLRWFERRNVAFILGPAVVATIAGSIAVSYFLPDLATVLGKDPDMSGRMPLWASAVASAMKRPLLGYGFGAFWTGMSGESLNIFSDTHFDIYQAQNGLLEVWLELGLVGVVLIVCTLLRATKDALVCLHQDHSPATNWYVIMIALTVAYNVDESFLASSHSLPWLMYIVACTGLAERVRGLRLAKSMSDEISDLSIDMSLSQTAIPALA